MKARIYFILILLLAGFSVKSQDLNRKIMDERFNKEVLIDLCDRMGLTEGEFGEFFKLEYEDFMPDKGVVNKIKRHKKDYSIVLVMGSWCPDCQELVPRLYKILDKAGIPDESITVICVDGYKKSREVPLEKYDISRVPTVIFHREGKEIGRITESPETTLEKDFFNIIN